jgi:imidazolonepropionase-like amidohydrolase
VRAVPTSGGAPTTLEAEERVRSVFYTADGRVGWTVTQGNPDWGTASTRIELTAGEGDMSVAQTLESDVDRLVVNPAGDGFYARHQPNGLAQLAELVFISNVTDSVRKLANVPRYDCFHRHPSFAVGSDGRELFFSDAGRLWRVPTAGGEPEPIDLTAHVTMEIRTPVTPPKVADLGEGRRGGPRILDPRLSPDGQRLVFSALGYLWEQPIAGGEASRLTTGRAFEHSPAFAPDGKRLAYVHGEHGGREIKVLDLESRETRTIAAGSYVLQPSWSSDGAKLALARWSSSDWTYQIEILTADGNVSDSLTQASGRGFPPRPHFAADGNSIVYESGLTDSTFIRRLSITGSSDPETLVRLCTECKAALVSSDGNWVAFRHTSELWLAPFPADTADLPAISKDNSTLLDTRAGPNFAFVPDRSALVYAVGNRVWRHSLIGGEREEIPIRLPSDVPEPPAFLLRRVRVLDLDTGFGGETSLLIEAGRITWIDAAESQVLPSGTEVLDAGGRFAVPGLFDVHVHAVAGNQAAYLAYGVTTVRDMGGPLDWLVPLDDRSRSTSEPVPRNLYAGEMFDGPLQPCLGCIIVREAADARTHAQRHKEEGVHFIKAYTALRWPVARAIVTEARRLDLPVAAHGWDVRQLTRGVTHGIAFLEHNAMWRRFYDDVFQLLAAAGTYWTPTLTPRGGTNFLFVQENDRSTDPKYCAFFPASCGRAPTPIGPLPAAQPGSPEALASERFLSNALADIRAARDRDVRVLLGTDYEHSPGHSLHTEMEAYVLAGLTPLEVLGIATQRAAEALGVDDEIGTLEPGKLADIVLLDANPLEDIRNSQAIWRVIKGGWVFDPEELVARRMKR